MRDERPKPIQAPCPKAPTCKPQAMEVRGTGSFFGLHDRRELHLCRLAHRAIRFGRPRHGEEAS